MSGLYAVESRRELATNGKTLIETPEIVRAAREVLTQGLELLFGIGDAAYSRAVGAPYNSSIGQHYRHILDHFVCLVKGVRAAEINYDARERNPRIEGEVTYATVVTCDMMRATKHYQEETLDRHCRVLQSVGYGNAAPTPIDSNIGRELAYCTGHAIHHFAIIRLMCANLGVTVPAEFGFAPSTLKNKSSLAAD